MEVIAYSAKTVPEGFRSRSILDLEVYSILNSLYSMQSIFSDGDIKVELPLLSPGAEAEFSTFEDEPKVEDEEKQKYEELTDTLPDRYIIQ
jgi:hypothetical protein